MATRIQHNGYAQLELNQVAFRRDGRIEAQSALNTTDFNASNPAENGMLLVLDAVNRQIKKPTAATDKVLLNYTTEHMYDERTPGLKHFALVPGTFLPRLGYLATGDKYTTNCISYDEATYKDGSDRPDEAAFWTAVKANPQSFYACPCANGSHLVVADATNAVAKVVKVTTMPDGQKAIQFIAL